jgi:hypothetical protein
MCKTFCLDSLKGKDCSEGLGLHGDNIKMDLREVE